MGRSVEANRVQAIGRGKNDPMTTPETCKGKRGQGLIKCLAPDRRVEVEVVGLVTPRHADCRKPLIHLKIRAWMPH